VSDRDTSPREGLPSCLSMVAFEERATTLRDRAADCGNVHEGERFYVASGILAPCDGQHAHTPPGGSHILPWCYLSFNPAVLTDDQAEAQAAFERGAEWVRTGVMV
jgi:hypothetical protein